MDAAPDTVFPRDEVELRVMLGPRDDWFTEDAIRTLLTSDYVVSSRTDRVGARLLGRRCPAPAWENCPAKGSSPEHCRSRTTATPCSSSPTTPSPAATR